MGSRIKVAIFGAVFFGFIAAYGIYNFLSQQEQELESLKRSTQSVVVAGKDINPGTPITEDEIKNGLVKIVQWPKHSIPRGTFKTTDSVKGKVVKLHTVVGEPLLESKLTGDGAGLTVRLQPGNRAMAVKVDEIVGVSGFIVPDDRVDVIVTTVPPGKARQGEKVSKVVLQNKRVLSVAQATDQDNGKPKVPRSITLEVTPEEAEQLSLSALDGQIILALRAVGDTKIVKTPGSTKYKILSISRSRRAVVGKRRYQVEIYKGTQKSIVAF